MAQLHNNAMPVYVMVNDRIDGHFYTTLDGTADSIAVVQH